MTELEALRALERAIRNAFDDADTTEPDGTWVDSWTLVTRTLDAVDAARAAEPKLPDGVTTELTTELVLHHGRYIGDIGLAGGETEGDRRTNYYWAKTPDWKHVAPPRASHDAAILALLAADGDGGTG